MPELGSSAAIVAALPTPLLFPVAVAEARYILKLRSGSGSALQFLVAERGFPLLRYRYLDLKNPFKYRPIEMKEWTLQNFFGIGSQFSADSRTYAKFKQIT